MAREVGKLRVWIGGPSIVPSRYEDLYRRVCIKGRKAGGSGR